MTDQEFFKILRSFHNSIEKCRFLMAYGGIYKVRISEGRDPETCKHANNAKMFFKKEEYELLKQAVNDLHKAFNEHSN